MTDAMSYETDFHAWAVRNAEPLRQRRLMDLDSERIAEELESMGASERREPRLIDGVIKGRVLRLGTGAAHSAP